MTTTAKTDRYIGAVGRRKTAIARVRITPAAKISISVNGKDFEKYFVVPEYRKAIMAALDTAEGTFSVTAKLVGGGISAQAEALRHGISRALVLNEPELRTKLKQKGFLKRDPRAKERRKFGLKKARKAPQWSKR
ncbi:MAG: 30S ribosomal protein S9 [bacterium]|nr:30S ribosomal protein S9 [bacterium]